MPNRIIKESIRTSETVASLSDFEFRLWIGLMVSADDAGRGDARPAIIKGLVFPLRDRVSAKDIDVALHGLAGKGCVSLYTVDGKPYFYFPTWAEHQRIRDCKPKYPDPADSDSLPQIAADCGESPQIAADCGFNPNPNPNTNPNPKESVKRFAPPTREEAQAYYDEIHGTFSLEAWISYYEQNGWMVGNRKMKDWKASMRYWQSKEKPGKRPAMTRPSMDYAADAEKKMAEARAAAKLFGGTT